MVTLERFYYQITGPESGRKWVFLHGLMGYSMNWRKIISAIEATECCLVFDQRGHGRSFQPEHGYGPEDYAEDLRHILDELKWQKVILVGHSMGGRNAFHFAAKNPERVEKLIIEDIGPEANPDGYKYYENLLNLVPTPFVNRDQARSFFKETFPKIAKTRENPTNLAEYFYANMIEKENGLVDWRFSKSGVIESAKSGRSADRWQELESLKSPTLLIRGENSPELSQDVYGKMIALNPMITGVVVPNAAHWVHSDQPKQFIEELKKFAGGF